jgi:hypothetical protein
MNNLQDFTREVFRMRRAQKDLKKYNTRANQDKVAMLERNVDIALEKMIAEAEKIKQMKWDAAAPVDTSGGEHV